MIGSHKINSRIAPKAVSQAPLPAEVERAMTYDWGVLVDAYLMDAGRVGDRYAATVFCDRSGRASDGTTVATPAVEHLSTQGGFQLLRAVAAFDHYVIVSELST
ncbi:hypothetical protein ACIQAL_19275 [Pseudomonas sp. NPDC088368]|uniref:hypothetical protein n=1 Tax=Pseudomonas sp. NPDC088368 TaxID=3364453 RepID=UPI0038300037